MQKNVKIIVAAEPKPSRREIVVVDAKPSRKERKALKKRAAEPVYPSWWIRCRRCGHQPRGTPQMACPSCKKVHGEWSPNPMDMVVHIKNQTLATGKQLAATKGEVEDLEESNCELRDRLRSVKADLAKAEEHLQAAELEREAVEVEALGKGPETKVRSDTLVRKAQQRVTDLTLKLCEAQEAVEKAEAELRAAEAMEKTLEDRESELQRKKDSLLIENKKLLEALQGIDRRGCAPSPSNEKFLGPEILALIGRGALAAAGAPAR